MMEGILFGGILMMAWFLSDIRDEMRNITKSLDHLASVISTLNDEEIE